MSEREAGPELDREIALHVFGTDAPHAIMSEWNLPPFSTDIDAAWHLMERLSFPTDRCFFEINVDADGMWVATFGAGFRSRRATTAPLAICLAALEYVAVLKYDADLRAAAGSLREVKQP